MDNRSLRARVFDGQGWNKSYVEGALIHDLWAEVERLRAALLKTKRSHYYCEDSWYSCPQSEDGCADDRRRGNKCDCGADAFNAEIDSLLSDSAQQKKVQR